MPITPETIRTRVAAALPDADVTVRDSTGGGDHFAVVVVSPSFEGIGLIDRHRRVYAALGNAMQSEIHALALETVTPAEQAARTGGLTRIASKKTQETP
jgi:stress-induced morphogen